MAELTHAGIAKTQTGEYPLHDALRDARSDLSVSLMLLPLPESSKKEKTDIRGTGKPQTPVPYMRNSDRVNRDTTMASPNLQVKATPVCQKLF